MTATNYLVFISAMITAWCVYEYHRIHGQLKGCSKTVDEDSQSIPVIIDKSYLQGGTTVWCEGSTNIDRICRFHKLCFSKEHGEFVILHGPTSIFSKVSQNLFDPTLIDLSSVPDHNTQYFEPGHLPVLFLKSVETVRLFRGSYLLMNRFNPGNIMHVFHDDLLPVFYTMIRSNLLNDRAEPSDTRLVFLDGFPEGDYLSLYVTLFGQTPILRSDLVKIGSGEQRALLCFEEAHVGLSNETIWYQYGFDIPQGPLPNTQLTAAAVRRFASFVHIRLGFESCGEQSDEYALLITRKSTRLIVNEIEVVHQIARATGMRVVTAGLESFSIPELIGLISCAKILVGMHGSLLILAMFLPVGSLLLELYPYAVNPDHYTPYQTLVQLPGMGIAYASWTNHNRDHSVWHPDELPENGGIIHLSLEKQERILASTEVPKHTCCSNPEWLFRIFQDTVVDIPSMQESLSIGLEKSEALRTAHSHSPPILPTKVRRLNCDRGTYLHLSWQQPYNIEYMINDEVKYEVNYEVLIQESGSESYKAYIVQSHNSFTFSEGLHKTLVYYAWVRCLVGDLAGPFAGVFC